MDVLEVEEQRWCMRPSITHALCKGVTRGARVSSYNCHCVVAPRRQHHCTRRIKASSRCGRAFHVDVRKKDKVTISIYGPHSGNVPGSRSDVYHLAQMSISKEAYHISLRLVH